MHRPLILFLLLVMTIVARPAAAAPFAEGSFTPAGKPWPVGRIITPKGPICTGVLIGRYTVLTAAHCLVTRAGDGYFSASLVHFALYPPGREQLYAKGITHHVAPGYPLPVSTDAASLARDWAVVTLDTPLGDMVPPAGLVAGDAWQANAPADWTFRVIAFGRARALHPTVRVDACTLLDRDGLLIRHDCVVEPGSSGSVLLGVRDGSVHALAVNVAVRRGPNSRTTATLLPASLHALAGNEPAETGDWQSPFAGGGEAAPWSKPPNRKR